MAQRHPEIGVVFPCAKQYVLFVTSSLESAGISLYNSDTTLSLASLVARIRGLSQTQRDLIRWFVCDLNGSDYNALYMPATMLHHVVTTRTSAKAARGLYWGLWPRPHSAPTGPCAQSPGTLQRQGRRSKRPRRGGM